MKPCLCLICFKPNIIWLDFLTQFHHYDVYIIIDDNAECYKQKYENYSSLKFIQIPNDECILNGFLDVNYVIEKKVTGWEKALYYFSTLNTFYEYVWFIEDDVFFNHEQTLLNIDSKYVASDLLTTNTSYKQNLTGHKNDWLWDKVYMKISPPYYKCLCSVVRMSGHMLQTIKAYANKHKTLSFMEALFPTLCNQASLHYDRPTEFDTVVWRTFHEDKAVNGLNLYHPVKCIKRHEDLRTMIAARIRNDVT
jgi:hypothetical protein